MPFSKTAAWQEMGPGKTTIYKLLLKELSGCAERLLQVDADIVFNMANTAANIGIVSEIKIACLVPPK